MSGISYFLRSVLGPKSTCPTLNRALQTEENDGFFDVDEKSIPKAETVQAYLARVSGSLAQPGSQTSKIALIPLAEREHSDLDFLVKAVEAFMHPIPVNLIRQRGLEPERLRMFLAREDQRKIDSNLISSVLERSASDRNAHLTIVVSFSRKCTRRKTITTCSDGRVIVILDTSDLQSSLAAQYQLIAQSACQGWTGMPLCPISRNCVMSDCEVGICKPAMCPLCLRKYSLAVGLTGPSLLNRYQELFSLWVDNGFPNEAKWFAERLAFLGLYKCVNQLDEIQSVEVQDSRMRQPDQPQLQQKYSSQPFQYETKPSRYEDENETAEKMKVSLASLKLKMRSGKTRNPPVYG